MSTIKSSVSDAVKNVFGDGTIHLNKPSIQPVKVAGENSKSIRLAAWKPDYPFTGELKGAEIKGTRGKNIPLMVMSPEEMARRHKVLPNARGMPMFVASDGKSLWLHPAPDGTYDLLLK